MEDDVKKDAGATPDELGDAGKKALEAERGARKTAEKELKELQAKVKEFEDVQAKVKEFEDAGKSQLEKLQGQVAELTKQTDAATAKAARFEIAAEKGLTPAQARRLVGATKEELEADADAMAEELGLKKKQKGNEEGKTEEETSQDERPLGRPKEELRSGSTPEAEETPDAAKLADSILKSPW